MITREDEADFETWLALLNIGCRLEFDGDSIWSEAWLIQQTVDDYVTGFGHSRKDAEIDLLGKVWAI